MEIKFTKYHGTGNDFILIDNRTKEYSNINRKKIAQMCHRRFGVGADGLMLLETLKDYDFKMVYYNSDGYTSSMCGNGGRCITAFAKHCGLITTSAKFMAIDGEHLAYIDEADNVDLKMIDVSKIEQYEEDFILNTGSPHYVTFVKDLAKLKVNLFGRKIRYSNKFKKEGINVNFIEAIGNVLHVRTYERGVEDETFSCGTGVVASALVTSNKYFDSKNEIKISTKGGELKVVFEKLSDNNFKNIWLKGPAVKVFEGTFKI